MTTKTPVPVLHLSIAATARHLGVSRPTIYAWIAQGKLTTVQFGELRFVVVPADKPSLEVRRD